MSLLSGLEADATEIGKVFKLAKSLDWSGLSTMWASEPIKARLQQGANAAELALEIAGLFFPPAAIAANDLEVADGAIQFLGPLLIGAATQHVAASDPDWAKNHESPIADRI